MSHLQVRDLILDVDIVTQIDDETARREVLRTIEQSAKARGDLGDANDARYELQALRSADYSRAGRLLDYVFYRGIAGYFVRPLRPLATLVALATLISLIRFARRGASSSNSALSREDAGGGRRRLWRRTATGVGDLLVSVLDTFSRIGPRRLSGTPSAGAVGERAELLVYRVLTVCVLIGLANSNPTLRDMVDALF